MATSISIRLILTNRLLQYIVHVPTSLTEHETLILDHVALIGSSPGFFSYPPTWSEAIFTLFSNFHIRSSSRVYAPRTFITHTFFSAIHHLYYY